MNSMNYVLCFCVFVVSLHAGLAIHCYVCQTGASAAASGEAEACADPFNAENAKSYLLDCSTLTEDKGNPVRNYTYCRKFVQDVEGDYRIVRSCATAGRPGKCIDRTGTAKIKLQYCECENGKDGEACNFASQSVSAGGVVLGLTTVGVLLSASLLH